MKNVLYTLILTTLSYNCKEQHKKVNTSDTAALFTINKKVDNSKYYTTQNTLIIATETGDTLKYSKDDFNKIVDKHPELFSDFPQNPDQAYYCNTDNAEFGSEAGQDAYYTVYAYILKQKNGISKYGQQRRRLIDIYANINLLFQHLQYGGTCFGHQYTRILGYAEYSIYLLSKKGEPEKIYDIKKQKDLYLKSLKQLIEDESKLDNETSENKKMERMNELNKIINQLDQLISDKFYLGRAQEFQYGYYEYY